MFGGGIMGNEGDADKAVVDFRPKLFEGGSSGKLLAHFSIAADGARGEGPVANMKEGFPLGGGLHNAIDNFHKAKLPRFVGQAGDGASGLKI